MAIPAYFLLDTNIVSDLIRHPQGKVTDHIARIGAERVCTSLIVVSELRSGAEKKGSAKLARQLERILEGLLILPYSTPADFHYGRIRAELERSGLPIGSNDLLVAAHALALDAIVVTNSAREFTRVPGLRVENWLEAPGE